MQEINYLLSVKAEDRPGLLHLITGVLNRKLIPVKSLTAAPTDIHGIVLITIETAISERALGPLLFKLESIIEVFAVEAIPLEGAITQRTAIYFLDKALLSSPQAAVLTRFGVQIINMHPKTVTVTKSGNDQLLHELYNALERPYLLAFNQTGIITDTALMVEDQSSVINRLAA